MISHLLGFIFATSCMITVSIHWFQTSDLTLILHEHLNCELILPTMNAIGISTLIFCALIHAFLVTYIFLNHYQQRFSSYYVSYKGKYVMMNQKFYAISSLLQLFDFFKLFFQDGLVQLQISFCHQGRKKFVVKREDPEFPPQEIILVLQFC